MPSKIVRRETLTSMWELTASAVLRALSSDAPSASALEVARKFLADNGCSLATLQDWRNGPIGFDPKTLPTFDDSDEDERPSGAPDPALTAVPPFTAED